MIAVVASTIERCASAITAPQIAPMAAAVGHADATVADEFG